MGYTIENKKVVIWTNKVFVADSYPFQDEGTNYTCFYKNLKDSKHFLKCEARLSDEEKLEMVAKEIGLQKHKIILKSKRSHFKKAHSK